MKTSFVTFTLSACLLAFVAADVSHLSSSYLPPPKPEQVEHMTIEQHELRELPEQVDYMRENAQGAMEMAPSSQLTPPDMPREEQMMLSTRYLPPAAAETAEHLPPATRYLPPAQPTQRAEPEPESMSEMMQPETLMMMMPEPAMEYMAPVEQEPQPQAPIQSQPQQQTQPQVAPAMRYLPPPMQQQSEEPQYTYQQYQEQLQQAQQEQQGQEMPYILDVQQPTAPSDVETPAYEPEPAHELRQDGYHYKQAAEEQRLRH